MSKHKIIAELVVNVTSKHKRNIDRRNRELNKLLRFIKSFEYFEGDRRKLNRIVLRARRNKKSL